MTGRTLVAQVIQALADVEGVRTDEVDSLYDYIDPEILDRLTDMDAKGAWRFTFEYKDHQVTVTHDSEVVVDGDQDYTERSL